MRVLPLILLLFLSNFCFAEISLISIDGASDKLNFQSGGANQSLEVLGGLGGDENTSCIPSEGASVCCSNKDSLNTCNNCDGNYTVCNKHRVHSSLNLRIQFSSNSAFGNPTIAYTSSSTTGDQPISAATSSPTTTTATGATATLTVDWDEICRLADPQGDATNCSDASTGTLSVKVGISKANDGKLSESGDDSISFTIKVVAPVLGVPGYDQPNTTGTPADCSANGGGLCNFTLVKGDEKATIEDLSLIASAPGGSTYKYIYFYCSQNDSDWNTITSADECTSLVLITGDNALSDNVITGLTNGVTYRFRAAMVDEAGNIGRYFKVDTECTDSVTTNCHSVVPEEVVGLFNDTNCFIATAAYGSPMEKQVKSLRRFRDDVLRKTSLGRALVAAYYTLSPPAARWIAQKSYRRTTARIVLTPIVFTITAMMDYPLALALLSISALFGFLFWLRRSRGVRAW